MNSAPTLAGDARSYRYRALDNAQRLHCGIGEARDRETLAAQLSRRHLRLLRATALPRWHPHALRPLERRQLADFSFQLGELLDSGLPLLDALSEMMSTGSDPALRPRLQRLIDDIHDGHNLHTALHAQYPAFPPSFVAMVAAAEQAGCLPEIIHTLHELIAWEEALLQRLRQGLRYPALLLAATLLTAGILFSTLVPQLRHFLQQGGQALPWYSEALFFTADQMRHLAPVAGPLLVVALLLPLLTRHHAGLRRQLGALPYRLPFVGPCLQQLQLARFSRLLGTLYRCGIPIIDALELSRHQLDEAVGGRALGDCLSDIRRGCALAEAFERTDAFPPLLTRMLRLGECSGHLDRSLLHAARLFESRARQRLETAQQLAEPCLTLTMGLLLGWIALAIIAPMQDWLHLAR